jgi:hypothetical protein
MYNNNLQLNSNLNNININNNNNIDQNVMNKPNENNNNNNTNNNNPKNEKVDANNENTQNKNDNDDFGDWEDIKVDKVNNDCENYLAEELQENYCKISTKIEELFQEKKLKKLKKEDEILNFFANNEKKVSEYIDKKLKNKEIYKTFMFNYIEDKFKNNDSIKDKTHIIYLKLAEIPMEQIQTENEFHLKLKQIFPKIKIPYFLINNNLKTIKKKELFNKANNETNDIIKKNRSRELDKGAKRLINIYEKIKNKEIEPFSGINNRKELLYLFININNKIFHKIYCEKQFFYFLEDNESLLQRYFGNNIKYFDIYENFRIINIENDNINKEKLLQIIKNEISNNIDKLLNIIASFYYILFYEFKDKHKINKISNIGNAYMNVILKKFVIILDQNINSGENLNKKLFLLLTELYKFDINRLINIKFYNSENKKYVFNDIDSLLLSDESIRENYENLKIIFTQKEVDNNTIIGMNLGKDLSVFEKNIKLTPVDANVYSNTITILIDGFTTQGKNPLEQWKGLVDFFDNESMFYFYNWPSDSVENILNKGVFKAINNASIHFASAKNRAKVCGKLLAYILYSSKFFPNFQINLIGFSLGNHVLKNCIKELGKINNNKNFVKIKNVILIAAATRISNKNIWKKYIEEIIIDRFINCYSKEDDVLKWLFGLCMLKQAVGNDILEIKNDNNVNLVSNYDFTLNKFGHLSYDYKKLAETIFSYYKDI